MYSEQFKESLALVEAARAAYDKIATETQKALISDLRIKLEQAEKRIAYA